MRMLSVVFISALCYLRVSADSAVVSLLSEDVTTVLPHNTEEGNVTIPKPDVYNFHVYSDIRFRFAHTVVSSRIANPANVAQEVYFTAVLPETAFISGFLMEIDDHVYNAYIVEKLAAKQEYTEAMRKGRTLVDVSFSQGHSNKFTVSVNVEPQKKVTFNLTYEELLNRKLGSYKHVINLDPGQIVQDFSVEVHINESSDISSIEVPAIRTSNEITDDPSTGANNPLAIIERPNPHSAIVKFAPTPAEQQDLASDGIKGQLIVQYDVDRTAHPGEVLVNDGYFVHFFAPPDLPPLPKQVTFVLDVSGSMSGRKIEQLRQAMLTILDDLHPEDLFSIILFSSAVQVWNHALSESAMRESLMVLQTYPWGENPTEGGQELPPTVIATATAENITKAKAFVQELTPLGGTNTYGALIKGLEVTRLGQNQVHTQPSSENNNVQNETNEEKPEPIIIFLTDGQPNVGISDPNAIVLNVTDFNTGNLSIFSLALGNDADLGFLKKLSLRNSGFARKIYEASDTALQLRDFYRQVLSPLLANVNFIYPQEQVDEGTLTKRTFRRLFNGAELVVAGKLLEDNVTSEVRGHSSTGSIVYPFIPICILPPLPPQEETNKTVSPMERLWAYLTIQQLLEEHDAKDYSNDDHNQTSPEKQRALELALQYSFVTPLTSLVVVKPNETNSVDTEDASSTESNAGPPVPVSAAFPHSLAAPYPLAPGSPGSLGISGQAAPDSSIIPAPVSPFIPPPTHLGPVPVRVNFSDVTWISESDVNLTLSVLGVPETLQLASANETDTAHGPCYTPRSEPGHCRHFRYCVLDVFTQNKGQFEPYFCRIDSYVGTCCPNYIDTHATT